MIDIIDKGAWGNTAEEAAAKYVIHKSGEAATLQAFCNLLENTITAELPVAVEALIQQVK